MYKIKDALSKSFVVALDERDAEQLANFEDSNEGVRRGTNEAGAAPKKLNNQVVIT